MHFGEKTKKEYNRLKKNARSKIRYMTKKYGNIQVGLKPNAKGEMVAVPINLENEIKIPELESFNSRKEFNAWAKSISSFTNRANTNYQFKMNEHGVSASKHILAEIERNTEHAQKIAKEIQNKQKDQPLISGGKVIGTQGVKALMLGKNPSGYSIPKPFDFNKVRSRNDLYRKHESMMKKANPHYYDTRAEIMKQNFIGKMKEMFNSDASQLIDMLWAMPNGDFYEMYQMFEEMDFNVFYKPEFIEFNDNKQVLQIQSYIERYYEGKINTDLWGF